MDQQQLGPFMFQPTMAILCGSLFLNVMPLQVHSGDWYSCELVRAAFTFGYSTARSSMS